MEETMSKDDRKGWAFGDKGTTREQERAVRLKVKGEIERMAAAVDNPFAAKVMRAVAEEIAK